MKLFSGRTTGTSNATQLANAGVGGTFAIFCEGVGAAEVVFQVAPTKSGPWFEVTRFTEDGGQISDIPSRCWVRGDIVGTADGVHLWVV